MLWCMNNFLRQQFCFNERVDIASFLNDDNNGDK